MSADAGKNDKGVKKMPDGKKKGKKRSSAEMNDVYVERARQQFNMLVDGLSKIYESAEELTGMNHKKRGRPFKYSQSLMDMISTLANLLNLSYRSCNGMVLASTHGKSPHFSTMCRRRNAQYVPITESRSEITCENISIDLVPDGTGLTSNMRSEYVRVVHKLKRGFYRLTIMINKNTLEIVSFQLTEDTVGETTVFKRLLEDALENFKINPNARRIMVKRQKNRKKKTYKEITLTGDGAYDTREIFSLCNKLDIHPKIRIRKDANARAGGVDRARSKAVLEQFGGSDVTPAKLAKMSESKREENRKKWKESVNYGARWLVEIVISAFKRNYGDSVRAKKIENVRQEIRWKIRAYNHMLKIGREVCARA